MPSTWPGGAPCRPPRRPQKGHRSEARCGVRLHAAGDVATVPDADVDVAQGTELQEPWVTIVWNDPVNLMTYVSFVFESYFGYSEQKATALMAQVHNEGKAVVSTGGREKVERDVAAMHGFGLWATMQKADA